MAVQGDEPVEASHFAEIEDLFFDALDLPPDQRDTWLSDQCQGRQALLTEVQTLLEAHESSESFLSESPDLKGIAACPDLSGRQLGNYQVDAEIAKGGMGRVYSADRVDGEYQQRVAIKVVELGNVEAEMFRRERQTLANLEHPNIVTLLDGGTLEEGFPYLVMELVDGKAIDEYSIEQSLSRKPLLTIFCTLCEVVDHAHQQEVIHCDLKPANILVTDQGILKLLDFGISQTLIKTQDSQQTALQSQALTPEYASPQRQAHQSPHVTDDVYSLGIILGQLLIGEHLPRMATELLVKQRYKKIDIEQMLQLIPSHELRMVIKKATNSSPQQRYQSAGALAEDLQNFLQEKPVHAITEGSHGRSYTLYKNLTRNRNFWAVFLVSLFLLGTVGYFWNKNKVAELNANAAAAVKNVIADMDAVFSRTEPPLDILVELIGIAVQNIEGTLANAPENIPALQAQTESLVRLGQHEGHPLYLNRGNYADAKSYFLEAESRLIVLQALVTEQGDEASDVTDEINTEVVTLALLRVRRLLLELEWFTEDRQQALRKITSLEQAFSAQSFTLKSQKQTLAYRHDLLSWAKLNLMQGRYDAVERYLKRSEQLAARADTIKPEQHPVVLERTLELDLLTPKQKNEQRKQQKAAENFRQRQLDYLNEAHYLKALTAAQRGHIAYFQKDYQIAERYYQSIESRSGPDIRLTPLVSRVLTLRSCAMLVLGQSELASELQQQLHNLYQEFVNQHPSARRFVLNKNRLNNKDLKINERLDCEAPEYTIFPLRTLPPLTDD